MSNKRGITLIALIITIIVMLILVAVVINVAYQEGLFEKARIAAYNTQKEAYKEELTSAVASTYKAITAENVKKGLRDAWSVSDNEDGTLLCCIETYVFIVNKNKGTINEGEGGIKLGTTTLSINSINATGEITGVTLIGVTGNVTWTSSDTNIATVTGNNTGATVTAKGEGTAIITAHVGGKTATCNVTVNLGWVDNGDGTYTKGTTTYSFGQNNIPTSTVLSALGIEAVSGKYNGKWTVIGVENNKLKLVSSANIGGNVLLGKNDTNAINAANETLQNTDLNNDGIIENANIDSNTSEISNQEKSIWSYNHAVETLDYEAQSRTGIPTARSIRINDIESILNIQDSNKGEEYNKIYVYYFNSTKNKIYSKTFPAGTSDGDIKITY